MRFKTTQNIFNDFQEYFNENWMDSDIVQLPYQQKWDYSRELKVEDVDIWEVIYEQGGSVGVYGAWSPYAELYLIRVGHILEFQGYGYETYYGAKASEKVYNRCKELKIPLFLNTIWVEPEEAYLYM